MRSTVMNFLSLLTLVVFFLAAVASSGGEDADKLSNYIKGINPAQIYVNLENQNFHTEKIFMNEYGNSWISSKSIEGIDYKVETYSNNARNVETVRATVVINPQKKKIIAAQHLFLYLSSLPYENAEPSKVRDWIIENYDNDKASILVGEVRFTLYAPSSTVRVMRIEKDNSK